MTPLIDLSGITKVLKGQEQQRTILSGVDLTRYDDRGGRLPALIERLLAQVPVARTA